MDRNGGRPAERSETLATAAGHTHGDSYVHCSGRVGCAAAAASSVVRATDDDVSLLLLQRWSARVLHMVVVSSRWCRCFSPPFLAVLLLVLQLSSSSSSLDHVVSLLLAYALMPPAVDRTAAAATVVVDSGGGGGGGGGSRVRETKKALLGGGRYARASAATTSRPSSVVAMVAAGTVSKITEKFQAVHLSSSSQPPRSNNSYTTATRIPKLSQHPVPVPVVKYEILRRQEKLLSADPVVHRTRRSVVVAVSSFSASRIPIVGGAAGDSGAASSDCGSSSDSEKSVRCCDAAVVAAVEDVPGSPHSSGYESVEETTAADHHQHQPMIVSPPPAVVPYSWVFGGDGGAPEPSSPYDAFDGSSVSSSSSDDCYRTVVDAAAVTAPEDRLERLVTFAPPPSCPALSCRAKPDQDDDQDDDDGASSTVHRHFAGNDVATAGGGYLSPIPECSSTEPNSVETVEDCRYSRDDDHDKVYHRAR